MHADFRLKVYFVLSKKVIRLRRLESKVKKMSLYLFYVQVDHQITFVNRVACRTDIWNYAAFSPKDFVDSTVVQVDSLTSLTINHFTKWRYKMFG